MKKYKIKAKKIFDENDKVTLRNVVMLIEAIGIVYLENNPHLDRIKHLLEEVNEESNT